MSRFELLIGLALALSACDTRPVPVLWLPAPVAGSTAGRAARSDADAGAITAPLTLQVEVSSETNRCEDCALISALAQGGSEPYSYLWSEPGLVGPGPHTVCPNKTTTYFAAVTDSAGRTNGSLGTFTCVSATNSTAIGCVTRAALATNVTCETVAGLPLSLATPLAQPLTMGATYQGTLALSGLQLSIGDGMAFELYGARSPCAREQLLGVIHVNASAPTQSFCFVASQAYTHVLAVAQPAIASIALTLLDSAVYCNSGCAPAP